MPLNVDVRRAIASYLEVRPTVPAEHPFIGQRGQGISVGKQALDAGADLVSVPALLGHQRLETTAIYTPPSQRHLEKVVEKLERDGDDR